MSEKKTDKIPELVYDASTDKWTVVERNVTEDDTCDAYVMDEHGNLVYKKVGPGDREYSEE